MYQIMAWVRGLDPCGGTTVCHIVGARDLSNFPHFMSIPNATAAERSIVREIGNEAGCLGMELANTVYALDFTTIERQAARRSRSRFADPETGAIYVMDRGSHRIDIGTRTVIVLPWAVGLAIMPPYAAPAWPRVDQRADCCPLRWRRRGPNAVLCRAIPRDGVRATDLSREPARYRGLPIGARAMRRSMANWGRWPIPSRMTPPGRGRHTR